MVSTTKKRSKVVVCHAPDDRDIVDEFLESMTRPEKGVAVHVDSRAKPGRNWRDEIQKEPGEMRLAILFLSPAFLALDYIASDELPHLLAVEYRNGLAIVPVFVEECAWDRIDGLRQLPLANSLDGPLRAMDPDERAAAWKRVAAVIKSTVQSAPLENTRPTNLFRIPYSRNPFFTGRADVLDEMREALTSKHAVALTEAREITGFGGIGKTQTAVEYAYRHRDDYDFILWVQAQTETSRRESFVEIARLLELPEADAQNQNDAAAAARRWLMSRDGWLLVLDNVDDLGVVGPMLDSLSSGHVLMTTRLSATSDLADPVALGPMSDEDGAMLVLVRGRILKAEEPLETASPADRQAALDLARELRGLPLALDQAGAYIEETRSKPADYLRLLRERMSSLLVTPGSVNDSHPSVTAAVTLASNKVALNNPAAGDLMRLCAFLAPDAVPEELFTKGAAWANGNSPAASSTGLMVALWRLVSSQFVAKPTQLPGDALANRASNPVLWERVLAAASRYSLLQRDPDAKTFRVHRLVQAILQDSIDPSERRQWQQRVVRVVSHAFPNTDYANWALCERLLPHALVCAEWIRSADMDSPEAAKLLSNSGLYLKKRAQYAVAGPLCRQAAEIYEKTLGPDHSGTATSLNNLATLYDSQGRDQEVEPLHLRALAIREKALGPEHPETAMSLNNLGIFYKDQGRNDEAEPLLGRALAINEKALGPDHPVVATNLNNLALLYKDQGRYDEAEPLYHRSLASREKALGSDHPDIAQSLNNLATLYGRQKRYSEAESLHLRAVAIREKALGPDDPSVATSLHNLAGIYKNQRRYVDAEPLYVRVLAINEKALGPEHPRIAASLNDLAGVYRRLGRYGEAKALYERALAIYEGALGVEHPDRATARRNYELLLQDMSKTE